MTDKNISDLRRDYGDRGIDIPDLHENPVTQFERWFEDARDGQIYEPNAMTLSTVDAQGRPSARVVLLKDIIDGGFVFYTNYASRKADDLAESDVAALTFWWDRQHRQVRIEGTVQEVSADVSDAYFNSRPVGSRLGAIVSEQSAVIESRSVLEDRLAELEAQYADSEPSRPDNWGGYRVEPRAVEFWQGRTSRLHDRVRYTLEHNGAWTRERLAP